MQEEWRQVESFPKYFVSNFGRIRTLFRDKEIFLKQGDHYKGYKVVWLYGPVVKNQKNYMHRLVAEAFIPNPEKKPIVNHIDCNKINNHITNLEWATECENAQWYHKNKLKDNHEF